MPPGRGDAPPLLAALAPMPGLLTLYARPINSIARSPQELPPLCPQAKPCPPGDGWPGVWIEPPAPRAPSPTVPGLDSRPLKERSFDSHRSQHSKGWFQRKTRFKSLVRKEPVIANGDAQAGQNVHTEQQAEVHPTEAVAPEEHSGQSQAGDGQG